jgi:hypothetical protein
MNRSNKMLFAAWPRVLINRVQLLASIAAINCFIAVIDAALSECLIRSFFIAQESLKYE